MRTVSSSVMAVLVFAAMLWGNCLSCPQMWAAAANHHDPHSCCHHGQTVKVDCQSQGLHNFVKADPATHVPALAVMIEQAAVNLTAALPIAPVEVASAVGHAPPDLLCLHSSFRI
jgi:hypothetical protein